MYTYSSLNYHFNWESKWIKPGNTGLTMRSRPGGIILTESTKIRWFLRWWGWGGWSLLSEAKSLKTTQVRSLGSSLLRLDGSHDGLAWGRTSYPAAAQGLYSLKAKGNYQARVHSDQTVLMIVRQEAGPVAWWLKTLKWELENNSGQPGDLTEKRQSDSLK
jgi:hypothetical protein